MTRLLMGLVFVFVTITSPLHAQAMASNTDQTVTAVSEASMPGMSAECAKAMAAQAAKDTPAKNKLAGHIGDGCNCPLSHCPATPSLLTYIMPAVFPYGDVLAERACVHPDQTYRFKLRSNSTLSIHPDG